MAKRYGGQFSPQNSRSGAETVPSYHGARKDPVGGRANALFFPPVVLAATSLNDGAIGLGLGLTGAAALLLGAWLLREGLRAEVAFQSRNVARRPAIPRKIFAALLAGLGVGIAAYKNEPGLVAPAIYALATTGLHIAAFGIDPMRDKGSEEVDDLQNARVTRAIEEGEGHLETMADAIAETSDRDLIARVAAFSLTARKLFRLVEEDPADLTGARKYMTLYLSGARASTEKFANLYLRNHDLAARSNYVALLEDLEQNYASRVDRLLENDRDRLDIEMEVLRDRLSQTGPRRS